MEIERASGKKIICVKTGNQDNILEEVSYKTPDFMIIPLPTLHLQQVSSKILRPFHFYLDGFLDSIIHKIILGVELIN